jgi:DNA-binding CsgD family transcriptional regulator
MRREDLPGNSSEEVRLQGSTPDCSPGDLAMPQIIDLQNREPRISLPPRGRLRSQPGPVPVSKPALVGLVVPSRFKKPGSIERERLTTLPVPSEARLRQLFDLTPAEARLAQALARGDALEEVAVKLKIKMTTARTQLAAIFAKTQTRRQAGLVAILSRLAHLDEIP